uniref:Uncharacterized protein n=1 Tax=Knipowitschia caucasica TaxID=637954 RepID=A0AAV2MIW2_KNICA
MSMPKKTDKTRGRVQQREPAPRQAVWRPFCWGGRKGGTLCNISNYHGRGAASFHRLKQQKTDLYLDLAGGRSATPAVPPSPQPPQTLQTSSQVQRLGALEKMMVQIDG